MFGLLKLIVINFILKIKKWKVKFILSFIFYCNGKINIVFLFVGRVLWGGWRGGGFFVILESV